MTAVPKSFGSFQCESVDYLLSLPGAQYTPPHIEHLADYINRSEYSNVQYGVQCKQQLYGIDPSITFINHGAFGCTFRHALQFSHEYSNYVELNTLNYYDRVCLPTLVYCIRSLAQFLHVSNYKCLTLCNNATIALNSVIASIGATTHSGERIVTFSTAYGSVKKMLSAVQQRHSVHVDYVDITFPVAGEQAIVAAFQQYIDKHIQTNTLRTVKYAVFDHISSNTAFVYPLQQLIAICKQHNVLTIVDGAHACMQLDLNLTALGADVYVSNLHKWFCNVKGAAFLYVAEPLHSTVHSSIISHGANSSFSEQFLWHGNDNYANYVALCVTLNIWHSLNIQSARAYCRQLLQQAAQLLTEQWHTHTLAPVSMHSCMICVALPGALHDAAQHASDAIQSRLWLQHRIEVPVKTIAGCNYVRLSVMVYNTLQDYQTLSDAVVNVLTNITATA